MLNNLMRAKDANELVIAYRLFYGAWVCIGDFSTPDNRDYCEMVELTSALDKTGLLPREVYFRKNKRKTYPFPLGNPSIYHLN